MVKNYLQYAYKKYFQKHKIATAIFISLLAAVVGSLTSFYLQERTERKKEKIESIRVLQDISEELKENTKRLENKKGAIIREGLVSLSKIQTRNSPRTDNISVYMYSRLIDRELCKEIQSYYEDLLEINMVELYVVAFLDTGDFAYLLKTPALKNKVPSELKDSSFREELVKKKLKEILIEYIDELINKTNELEKRLIKNRVE